MLTFSGICVADINFNGPNVLCLKQPKIINEIGNMKVGCKYFLSKPIPQGPLAIGTLFNPKQHILLSTLNILYSQSIFSYFSLCFEAIIYTNLYIILWKSVTDYGNVKNFINIDLHYKSQYSPRKLIILAHRMQK